MSPDNTVGLIASLGVLTLLLLGLVLIVRGLFTGLSGSTISLAPPIGFGQGVLGRTVANLLSFAVAYKFFFEGYTAKLYDYNMMITAGAFALLAMTLVSAVETLVAIAALTLFLMQNTAVFGPAALETFLVLLGVYALLRWVLGR